MFVIRYSLFVATNAGQTADDNTQTELRPGKIRAGRKGFHKYVQMKRFRLVTILIAVSLFAPGSLRGLEPARLEITRENVLAAMNRHREEKNLPPLRVDHRLDLAAEDRMRDMEEIGYWSHESPEGRSPFFWLALRGYRFGYAGENLAKGFETAAVLVDSWMESKGHRENIVSANYADCGIAIIDGSTTGKSTGKSIVVLFATLLEP